MLDQLHWDGISFALKAPPMIYKNNPLAQYLPANPPLPKQGYDYTLWYGRNRAGINGVLTLNGHDGKGNTHEVLTRYPARSGQLGALLTDAIRGKSAIPYFGKGMNPPASYWLWTKCTSKHLFLPKTKAGIGRFYPISTHEGNPRKTVIGGIIRWDLGLHPDNAYPGSAGCVVGEVDTEAEKQTLAILFNFLDALHNQGTFKLQLKVVHYETEKGK